MASHQAMRAAPRLASEVSPLLWLLVVAGVVAGVSMLASAISPNGIGY